MNKTIDDIVRMAAEVGAQHALATIEKERARRKKEAADWRLHNTKLLLKNYRSFKLHCSIAISDAKDQSETFQDLLKEIWAESELGYDAVTVDSIRRSVTQTQILLNHIDDMLYVFKMYCERSKNPEDVRKYRIICALYINDKQSSIEDIAEKEMVDKRTVYRDIDAACKHLSALLFGVEAIAL